jgi:hypothetical protein
VIGNLPPAMLTPPASPMPPQLAQLLQGLLRQGGGAGPPPWASGGALPNGPQAQQPQVPAGPNGLPQAVAQVPAQASMNRFAGPPGQPPTPGQPPSAEGILGPLAQLTGYNLPRVA